MVAYDGLGNGWGRRSGASSASKGLRNLFRTYSRRCKRSNTYFDLTLEQFNAITKKLCAYCEAPPKQRVGEYIYNGIDRRNNSGGYFYDNCLPCCWECNRIKGHNISEAEMREIGEIRRKWRLKKQKE